MSNAVNEMITNLINDGYTVEISLAPDGVRARALYQGKVYESVNATVVDALEDVYMGAPFLFGEKEPR